MSASDPLRVRVQSAEDAWHRGSAWLGRTPLGRPVVHAPLAFAIALAFIALRGPGSFAASMVMSVLVYAIAALGLNIPAGFGGSLSLGQGAAFALGAYTAGALTVYQGWPFWASLPCAAAVGCVFGLVLGAPASRLGDIGLALVSLGAVLIVGDMIVALPSLTGGSQGLSPIGLIVNFHGQPSSSLWPLPILIAVSALAAYLVHYAIRASVVGRSAVATRDDAIGAMAVGISNYATKLTTFALGSVFGAFAGGLFAFMEQYISQDAFSSQLSVILLAMVVLGGGGSILGPVIGAIVLVVLPQELASYPHVNNIIYGAILMLIMLFRPAGIIRRTAVPVRHSWDGAPGPAGAEPAEPIAALPVPVDGPAPASRPTVLRVEGVSRSFGGLKALDNVSLEVEEGEVLALIGPNGSGKTTAINVITGMYQADSGTIWLGDADITGLKARRIAEAGIARTFQTPKTFGGLSIAEHLVLAKRLQTHGSRTLGNPDPWVRRLLNLGGIDPDDPRMMARESRELGHGQLRFLEIAMAIRHMPRLLLLDEPAAGLSHTEMEGLEDITRQLADLGIGVIIVEHHLDLVTRLADRVAVLELGRVIWEGKPGDLVNAEVVRTAYLGGSA